MVSQVFVRGFQGTFGGRDGRNGRVRMGRRKESKTNVKLATPRVGDQNGVVKDGAGAHGLGRRREYDTEPCSLFRFHGSEARAACARSVLSPSRLPE